MKKNAPSIALLILLFSSSAFAQKESEKLTPYPGRVLAENEACHSKDFAESELSKVSPSYVQKRVDACTKGSLYFTLDGKAYETKTGRRVQTSSSCPDTTPLDHLVAGTEIVLKKTLTIGAQDELVVYSEGQHQFTDVDFSRNLNLILNPSSNSIVPNGDKEKLVLPHSCRLEDSAPNTVLDASGGIKRKSSGATSFKFESDPICAFSVSNFLRAWIDLSGDQINLGSLKFNLGKEFEVKAVCVAASNVVADQAGPETNQSVQKQDTIPHSKDQKQGGSSGTSSHSFDAQN